MIEPSREVLFGWGLSNHSRSLVYRPERPEQVFGALSDARRRGLTIVHRGAGQSYGDAALNQGGAVIETRGLNEVLGYDPDGGRIRVQAGVSVDQLWRHVIGDGWWPPVVPGTSRPTVGGCLAMNVHGKNHVQSGSFAEHVREVTLLTPDGERRTIGSSEPAFDRVVGTQGQFGTILSLEIELHSISSGYLEVEARSASDLRGAMEILTTLESAHEYTVAWIDCFSEGRAEIHAASYLPEGHEMAGRGLSVEEQVPPPRMFGVLPRRHAPMFLKHLVNDPGMQLLNAVKFLHARSGHPSRFLEPHARFHFLLDFIPEWRRVYAPGGLLQYQFFVPEDAAGEVFREALRLQREKGELSYLGVLKRHRRDPFPTNYSVDGFSLALDFPVREARLAPLMDLLGEFDALLRDAGGSIYAAKDAVSGLGTVPGDRPECFSSNLVRRWTRSG